VAIDRSLIDGPRAFAIAAMLLGVIFAILIASGMIAFAVRDFALRREEEKRLLEFQKAEAIGHFTSTTIHDFTNILAIVDSGLNQIVRGTSEQRTKDMVELVRNATERGARLTRQLLKFVRHDDQEIGTVDLEVLFDGLHDMLTRSLGNGVDIRIRIDPKARFVLANANQLEFAFINLAVNARDAMGGEGSFSVATDVSGDMVEVTVTDTGPGIAPAVRQQIFDPLFTTKEPGKGTGLGLAQVASAVEGAGGSVEARDGAQGGACFVLRLPGVQSEPARASIGTIAPDDATAIVKAG
jgi:signal transduction histidine kinase